MGLIIQYPIGHARFIRYRVSYLFRANDNDITKRIVKIALQFVENHRTNDNDITKRIEKRVISTTSLMRRKKVWIIMDNPQDGCLFGSFPMNVEA